MMMGGSFIPPPPTAVTIHPLNRLAFTAALAMLTPVKILLTGANGYVGSQLLPALLADGHQIRAMVRNPDSIQSSAEHLDVVIADVLKKDTLPPAMEHIDTAYYLIHSMKDAKDFDIKDRQAAQHFVWAAEEAGVKKIVYLGGLGNEHAVSKHIRSRLEVGHIFRASSIPAIEFRASIIIGAGSLSFQMIKALVNRLPVMITPKWVSVKAQPIYIDDVIEYLRIAGREDFRETGIFEIGGADQVSYLDIMMEYAHQHGVKRYALKVPLLTPKLSSYWLGLVTPLYANVGKKLIEGVRTQTVVESDRSLESFPIEPIGMEEAVRRALKIQSCKNSA